MPHHRRLLKKLQRQYRESLSDFQTWNSKSHAKKHLLFPKNIGPKLSIDETDLSKGELYTIITNKYSKGKKGSLVAIFSGTKVEPIVQKLLSISAEIISRVKEITLDMANSMKNIISRCFVNAVQVTDRFHVQKPANQALQDIRVQERWKALDIENSLILQARKEHKTFINKEFENGDTATQLLIRSRYLLAMDATKWTINQQQRAKILFKEYPLIYQAYTLTQKVKRYL